VIGNEFESDAEWLESLTPEQRAALIDLWRAPCHSCGRVMDMRAETLIGDARGFRCTTCPPPRRRS
jgi:hypothetical protein